MAFTTIWPRNVYLSHLTRRVIIDKKNVGGHIGRPIDSKVTTVVKYLVGIIPIIFGFNLLSSQYDAVLTFQCVARILTELPKAQYSYFLCVALCSVIFRITRCSDSSQDTISYNQQYD
jgi:hypothetical protein